VNRPIRPTGPTPNCGLRFSHAKKGGSWLAYCTKASRHEACHVRCASSFPGRLPHHREQMRHLDKYHKRVEWSEQDQVSVGKCPDLITVIQGDDPGALYGEICAVAQDVVNHFKPEGRALPPPRVRPMSGVA
jgi:hypothetical protein